ncbi:HlyD family secretion protein [Desulforamulus hydrothermalis]|uniref:Efflux transporter, RND family, MFP subunit n=1 Tax=Desulforamulus hydrothermalis Lam5 = DSM 18033 TaxID=1121428 RepID=K8DYV4_9FIRM|nr:efflux RND transporter periplasmic adaptor subunit [Desulforamulus hydrothermalis]CCO08147.1 Efflux transporter, RND family, MFP subunit [Desulforamulus hydrothermalis Lam5 = DSM 18033]SHH48252.1 HlyD family secretion protein [Desulforamulus hydrothermalis Lam5 = DSM 18033]
MEIQRVEEAGRFVKLKHIKGWPRRVKITLGLGLLLVMASVLMTFNRTNGGLVVQTAKAEKRFIEQSVMSSGRLEAAEKQEFFTPVDSTLMELSVKVGDRVSQGQVLGRLDTQELGRLYQQAVARLAGLEANLVRARATNDQLNFNAADAAYQKAKNKLDRISLLYSAGAVTIEELEQAKADLAQAEVAGREALVKLQQGAAAKEAAALKAQVDLAVQEVNQAKERLELATFVANHDGVVLFVGAEKGNRVLEGTRLLVVGNDRKLEVTAGINEIDAGNLQVGQPVKITCASLPEREFAGEVSRVAAVAVSENNNNSNVISVPVTIQLKGDISGLKPGYTVEVNIITMAKKKCLTVPFEALVTKNGEKYVSPPGYN